MEIEPVSKKIGVRVTNRDKREYVRINTRQRVEFVVGGRTYCGTIENKSHGGVFIKTRENLSVGQDISMTFQSPSLINEERTGKIARVALKGIGVKFNFPGYAR